MQKSPKYMFEMALNCLLETNYFGDTSLEEIKRKGICYLTNWKSSENVLSVLPVEIISNEILFYFSPRELLQLGQVNSGFYVLANQDKLWKHHYQMDWGFSGYPILQTWKRFYHYRLIEKIQLENRKSSKEESKGSYVIIDNQPHKILEVSYSKPGKCGVPKKRFVTASLLTGKKFEKIFRKSEIIPSTSVKETIFEVFGVEYPNVVILDENGGWKEIEIPDCEERSSIAEKLSKVLNSGKSPIIIVRSWLGIDKIIGIHYEPESYPPFIQYP